MEPNTFQVPFTEQSANRLLQLLDIAVKASGIVVAQDALVIAGLVQAAFQANKNPVAPA